MADLSLNNLIRILQLEQAKGYDDSVVVGGLDRYLKAMWKYWRAHAADSPSIDAVKRVLRPSRSYASLNTSRRRLWMERALGNLHTLKGDAGQPPAMASEGKRAPTTRKSNVAMVAAVSPRGGPPQETPTLDSPVNAVKGISRATASRLRRLGITTVRQMLYHFPRRHIDYTQTKAIADLEPGSDQTIIGTVWEAREVPLGGRRGTEAIVGDSTGNVRVVWFNQPYLARQLTANQEVVISGRVGLFKGMKVFESPEYEALEASDLIHAGRLVPVYPLTDGLRPRAMRRLMKDVVDIWASQLSDFLPQETRQRAQLLELGSAVVQAHFPDSWGLDQAARKRLAFDELFIIQLGVLQRKRSWLQGPGAPVICVDSWFRDGLLRTLPFGLTAAQHRALEEIFADLGRERPMSRLLQGDVGSGKTVVAVAALLAAVGSGCQGAFMAPTEILAEQHFKSLCALLEASGERVGEDTFALGHISNPLRVALLTGSLKREEKERRRHALARGEIDLIVGTHALIQEGVEFQKLGLVVVDEQHRFGVQQRWALRRKGTSPHVLVMSATPIPRSLALTLYGDLDLSVIDELPPGRQDIETRWLMPQERQQAYQFLRGQVLQRRQGFIICPLIEESAVLEVKAATVEYSRLSREVFPDLRLALVHGKMSASQKDDAMRRFRQGEMDILVATPVVEVGIDIPNATVMLVEGADRFGLSQLHQFRGRVGRGEHKSYCLLLAESPSAEARERLSLIEKTQDGFALAEADLRLRGPGEFFGTRQSGLPNLRMARMSDMPLLEQAREEALHIFRHDPELKQQEHIALAAEIAKMWSEGSGDPS